MRARGFNKRIEVWQTGAVSDGYGGFKSTNDIMLVNTWAKLVSLNANKPYSKSSTDYGISNTQLGIIVTVRRRNDLTYNSINQYIKYNGEFYTITSFPEDKNFDHAYITFVAVKKDLKDVATIEAVDVNAIYNNYAERVTEAEGVLNEPCQKEFINSLISD